ncbi:LCP family protein [Streptomyces ficellus]|uniref:LCP family protein n=1 Tax=Streptomyces ficellus TaxID=1977088 RepID=A0ABT7Z125_9ACTN|nr:LCP family protein [Streptomyces ficellus]MDN3293173.1 LCP family protein [Streptomyces ficellus]
MPTPPRRPARPRPPAPRQPRRDPAQATRRDPAPTTRRDPSPTLTRRATAPGGRRGAPATATGRQRRDRPRWAMRMVTTLSVLVLAAGGIGHAMVTSLDTEIGRVDPFRDMKNRPAPGHGTNILLVGTDGRDKITPAEKVRYRLGGAPCRCTDTIMLVHISADRKRASMVSLPRDSYAEIPPHTDATSGTYHHKHPLKLNAAYAEGGPNLTVRTVEHMTGVKVDHYLEVDFTSFMRTVDAIGGVEICTAKPMRDAYTGLALPAGTHKLDGGQALQYVRSRHVDGASDLGRMQRQQRFMAALIDQATSNGTLLNPVRFQQVVTAMLSSVRADQGFGPQEMLALAKAMRGFTAASSEFTSVPVAQASFPVKGLGSTVKWDLVKAEKLFQALRQDQPLAPHIPRSTVRKKLVEVSPQQIRVQVYNGTRVHGLGAKVDAALRATGFRTTRTALNWARRDVGRTIVWFDPRWDRSARSLATALPGAQLRPVYGQGATLKVTAGANFAGVLPVRAENVYQGEFGVVTGDQVVCG